MTQSESPRRIPVARPAPPSIPPLPAPPPESHWLALVLLGVVGYGAFMALCSRTMGPNVAWPVAAVLFAAWLGVTALVALGVGNHYARLFVVGCAVTLFAKAIW